MKWGITTIIYIIGIVVTVVLFNIGNEKPDIVYTVSGNIPMNTSDKSGDSNIHQIEVKNTGNKTAKGIQVLIDGEIIDSKVIKDSESDEVTIYPNKFELVYSELPPEGNFKLVIEATINGLGEDILTIKSENGLARNGIEDKGNSLLSFAIISLYFIIMVFSFRDIQINYIVKTIALGAYENINYMDKKKPFYIKENGWKNIIKTFIQVKIKKDLSTNHSNEKLNSIFILKSKKPECLSEEDWIAIKEEAKNTLILKIDYAFIQSYSDDYLLEFLNSIYDDKANFSETLNLKISKKLSSSYQEHKKKQRFFSTNDINKELTMPRPKFVFIEDWKNYQSFLGVLQYMFILDELFKSFNKPLEKIDEYENIIHEDNESLKKLGYDIEFYHFISNYINRFDEKIELKVKPNWMEDKDYQKINRIIVKINSNIDKEKLIDEQIDILLTVVSKNELPDEKPYFMSKRLWNSLVVFNDHSKEIINLKEETEKRTIQLNQKEESINSKKEEVNILKDKIERQLNIVNEVFNDPTVIGRIESYNNVFAKGNFENLVKLSEYLIKYNIDTTKQNGNKYFR